MKAHGQRGAAQLNSKAFARRRTSGTSEARNGGYLKLPEIVGIAVLNSLSQSELTAFIECLGDGQSLIDSPRH